MIKKMKNILHIYKNTYYKIAVMIIIACVAIILSYNAGIIFGKVISQFK